jgi:transposase-like protein
VHSHATSLYLTVHRSIPTQFLHEQLSQASPDLLRQMLTTFINTLMSADADAVCGAAWGERSEQRTNTRNGYRHRDFDTRVRVRPHVLSGVRPDVPRSRRVVTVMS